MKGLFIVCEGLDGAGKTTTIKEAMKKLDNRLVYNKGLKSDTIMGKIAPKLPSTFTFLLELIHSTNKKIKPALTANRIILQDRYSLSVFSFVPHVNLFHNRLLIKILQRFLLKPDLLVYFTVAKNERIKRLKVDNNNKYHSALVNKPSLIGLREKEYCRLYENFKGNKHKIDTTGRSENDVANEFIQKIVDLAKMQAQGSKESSI